MGERKREREREGGRERGVGETGAMGGPVFFHCQRPRDQSTDVGTYLTCSCLHTASYLPTSCIQDCLRACNNLPLGHAVIASHCKPPCLLRKRGVPRSIQVSTIRLALHPLLPTCVYIPPAMRWDRMRSLATIRHEEVGPGRPGGPQAWDVCTSHDTCTSLGVQGFLGGRAWYALRSDASSFTWQAGRPLLRIR